MKILSHHLLGLVWPAVIGPGMRDPAIAALVDACVVHAIGTPSENVAQVHAKIRKELPHKQWFQNEYEYPLRNGHPFRAVFDPGGRLARRGNEPQPVSRVDPRGVGMAKPRRHGAALLGGLGMRALLRHRCSWCNA